MNIKLIESKLSNTTSPNGKIGLILLATDQITLYEFDLIFKNTKVMYFPSRVMMEQVELTPEVLIGIKKELAFATSSILPKVSLDVVAFSCTSASMIIGEKEVERIIKQSAKDRQINTVTNPYTAIKEACKFLNIRELALITPYSKEVTKGIIDGINNDVKVIDAFTFNIPNDNKVPNITPESIKSVVRKISKDRNIKVIFISCTNLNICRYIEELEKETNKIILTSNQVMAWDILRLTKYKKPILGFGTLLEKER